MRYEHERSYFPLLLNEWGLLKNGVEVGVCEGLHAANILALWPGHLHLVDPWRTVDGYEEQYDHNANFKSCMNNLKDYAGRFTRHHLTSLVAAVHFKDASLDFVYLDANHAYTAVRDDLQAWYPKVRNGGILAGDDYGIADEQWVDFGHGRIRFGVKRAVDEFAHEIRRNISLDILADWKNLLPDRTEIQARGWWMIV